jgi:Flp pilus assembly protein TadD
VAINDPSLWKPHTEVMKLDIMELKRVGRQSMSKLFLLGFGLALSLSLGSGYAADSISRVSLPKLRPLSGGVSSETYGLTDDWQVIEQQVERHPDDPEAHFLLGVAYSRTPYVERALQELEKARKLARRSPEGYALFDRKIADYERMLAKQPKNTLILYRLGFAYYIRGYAVTHHYIKNSENPAAYYYDNAESVFNRLIALDPQDFSARNYLGYILAERDPDKNYFAAVNLWQESLKITENNPGAYILLGEAAMKKGNLKQAVECSAKALKARNDWLEAHNINPATLKIKL